MISTHALIWLLFVAFIFNDGEEVLTVEAGLRQHQDKQHLLPRAMRLNWDKPLTAQFAVAVALPGLIALSACWVGAHTFSETGRLHGFFVGALAVMFLDGVKHVAVSLYMRAYSSGVISAALVEVPYTVYAFHRFLGEGLVNWSEILRYGLIGLALTGPMLALGFALGRWVIPARKLPA